VCECKYCVNVQHPFVRDVTNMDVLVELVSEANAEVEYEEKDIDEVVSITWTLHC